MKRILLILTCLVSYEFMGCKQKAANPEEPISRGLQHEGHKAEQQQVIARNQMAQGNADDRFMPGIEPAPEKAAGQRKNGQHEREVGVGNSDTSWGWTRGDVTFYDSESTIVLEETKPIRTNRGG